MQYQDHPADPADYLPNPEEPESIYQWTPSQHIRRAAELIANMESLWTSGFSNFSKVLETTGGPILALELAQAHMKMAEIKMPHS
jgi:hypothetical protein